MFSSLFLFVFLLFQCDQSPTTRIDHFKEVTASKPSATGVADSTFDAIDDLSGQKVQTSIIEKEKEDIKSSVLESVEATFKKAKEDVALSIDSNSLEKDTFKDIRKEIDHSTDDSVIIGNSEKVETNFEIVSVEPSHEIWNDLLQKFVDSNGFVDYKSFKESENELDSYLNLLKNNTVQPGWSKNEKLAYWINTYNAHTIKLILKHYPVSSIMKINDGKAWDLKWIQLGTETYSLNQIEHEIIRPQFQEPRIHFAVNCAAKSCPPIANQAFTKDNVDSLLDKLTNQFIRDRNYNRITSSSVQISKIFEWYAEDFGDLVDYLNAYSEIKIKKKAKISFNEYNWALNGK